MSEGRPVPSLSPSVITPGRMLAATRKARVIVAIMFLLIRLTDLGVFQEKSADHLVEFFCGVDVDGMAGIQIDDVQ